MPIFETFQPAAFDSVVFPVDRVEVIGGIRDHVHEYPHQDGGSPEKLGRRLYTIRMHAFFDEGIILPRYKGNYPEGLASLRAKFESGLTAELTIPTLGTINAYCRNWPQTWTAQVLSGETAEFEFIESPSALQFTIAINLDGIKQRATNFQLRYADVYASTDVPPSILQDILDAADKVLSFRDQFDIGSIVLQQQIGKLTSLCERADRTVNELQRPSGWRMLEAMKELWAAAIDLGNDVRLKKLIPQIFNTPKQMTASEVSIAIFKTPERGIELLQMNPINDAFAIPAGFPVKYYADDGLNRPLSRAA